MFQFTGGYHEYIWGCSVHRGGGGGGGGSVQLIGGFQYKSKASMNLLPHMNHDIPQCTEHTLYMVGLSPGTKYSFLKICSPPCEKVIFAIVRLHVKYRPLNVRRKDSDHAKPCGSNKLKVEKNQSKIS